MAAPNMGQLHGSQMRLESKTIQVPTQKRTQLIDITEHVRSFVKASGIREGLVNVFSLHTTTGIFLNEKQAALIEDIERYLESLTPWEGDYKHNSPIHSDCERKNAASHLRALHLGNSVTIPVSEGAPVLGTYQCIFFCELDGQRKRHITMHAIGETADRS